MQKESEMKISLDLQTARRAYYNTSFDPDRRGDREVADFNEKMKEIDEKLQVVIKKMPEREAELLETCARLKLSVKSKWEAYLHAHSRVASSMITGPARFPVQSNMKKSNSAHNRLTDLVSLIKNIDKIIARLTRPKFNGYNELNRQKARLKELKEQQEFMRVANKALKKGKQAMLDVGIKEELANSLLTPDFCGRVGFPTYQLQNNLANIKRIEELIASIESRKTMIEVEIDGVKITPDFEENRVRIFFNGKPSQETIASLKKRGFRWSPRNAAWQRQLTQQAMSVAISIVKGEQ